MNEGVLPLRTSYLGDTGRCDLRVRHRKPGNARTEKTNGALVYLLLMAGCRITPVLGFWTGRALYWVKITFETGFKLPSSCINLPCYALNLNRNILDFMRWPQIYLGAQDLNDIQRPKYFQKIAGSEVLDEYYNSHLRK
jgi:hypothetical protein